jgi:hypothetical protein
MTCDVRKSSFCASLEVYDLKNMATGLGGIIRCNDNDIKESMGLKIDDELEISSNKQSGHGTGM